MTVWLLGRCMATQPCQIESESLKDSSNPFRGSRYRCLFRVASGETGDTYVVEHIELKKRFAAKLLRAEHCDVPHVIDRMRLEAQALGRLRHPNVVSITGFERTPTGMPFIVMELLRGRTLEAELRDRGALDVDEAIHWTSQLLAALVAIHEIGVVHRDLCPHNLILHTPKAGPRVLKVVDFGAARVLTGVSERSPQPLAFPTAEGVIVGSPEFASPEVSTNQAVDPRSDLYQVGWILYAMLTGEIQPNGVVPGSASRIAFASGVIPPASTFRSDNLDAAIDSVVAKALSRNPQDRFQTAAEFRLALEGLPRMSAVSSSVTRSSSVRQLAHSVTALRVNQFHGAWLFLALSTAIAIAVFAAGLLISRW